MRRMSREQDDPNYARPTREYQPPEPRERHPECRCAKPRPSGTVYLGQESCMGCGHLIPKGKR